jgi:hypothetical protein
MCALTQRCDWNAFLNWQATDETRMAIVVEACRQARPPVLILVKRVAAARLLAASLDKCQRVEGACVRISIDPHAHFVVATFSKLGTGFDHAGFASLVLACDVVEYFEQYAGRVLRQVTSSPTFVEIVDTFGPAWAHFGKRLDYYKALGASFESLQPTTSQSAPMPVSFLSSAANA